jgi:hypothetical protein
MPASAEVLVATIHRPLHIGSIGIEARFYLLLPLALDPRLEPDFRAPLASAMPLPR